MKTDLWLQVNVDDVLQTMDCRKTSPNYDEYVRACQLLIETYQERFKATGWMVVEGKTRANCLVVLEPSLELAVKEQFDEGDYLTGLLLNTMADHLLFDAVEKMERKMAQELAPQGLYLAGRVEPGCGSVPLEEVAQVLDAIKQSYDVEMTLTEGFMMEPVKSSAHYYNLDQDSASYQTGKSCESCERELCRYRKIPLKIIDKLEENTHLVTEGTNLLDALRRFGYTIEAPCGGRGVCNKCKVELFTEQGPVWIYACKTLLNNPMTIRLQNTGKGQVMSDYHMEPVAHLKPPMPGKISFGVDIGTTTIVIQCLSMDRHDLLDEERYYNPQRTYGADVISRIQYEHETGSKELTTLVRKTLRNSVRRILTRQGKTDADVDEIVLAGNTVMLYMLEGKDAFDLSVSPFYVKDPSRKTRNGKLLDLEENIKITLMPVISAYVGGDIVSGFYASDYLKLSGNVLYLDIGTNGEIALISNGRVITASTAAGPAFEGANISCGVASVDGAICKLEYENGIWSYLTIADKPPIGLNGSALIDLMDICRKQGWVDETGYMLTGDSVCLSLDGKEFHFTKADVRQLQLAKAAIAAGVRSLMEEVGISVEQLDRVYMAGGFGSHMDASRAIGIGLLPKVAIEQVFVLGNAALGGTIKYLMEAESDRIIDNLVRDCDYIELSMHPRFNELYIEEMFFP